MLLQECGILASLFGLGYVVGGPTFGQVISHRRIFMSTERPDRDTLQEKANRLYWESDESVNQISDELGLSKGGFYGVISPLPAGLPCPDCGEEMVFPNRTARDKGFLACPNCGMEEVEDAVQAFWEGRAEALGSEAPLPSPRVLARRAGDAAEEAVATARKHVSGMSPRSRVLVGTALLGVAAGLLLANYFRKR
jgi:hypothetical protein